MGEPDGLGVKTFSSFPLKPCSHFHCLVYDTIQFAFHICSLIILQIIFSTVDNPSLLLIMLCYATLCFIYASPLITLRQVTNYVTNRRPLNNSKPKNRVSHFVTICCISSWYIMFHHSTFHQVTCMLHCIRIVQKEIRKKHLT